MKKIPILNREKKVIAYTIIDDCDYEGIKKFTWRLHILGYVYTILKKGKRATFLHRYLLNTPKGMECDHINMNRLDNRRSNLRNATLSENKCNRGMQKNNKSGFKGVIWETRRKKWRAWIAFRNVPYFLGYFESAKEAAKTYDKKAIELHGKFAYLNFSNGRKNP